MALSYRPHGNTETEVLIASDHTRLQHPHWPETIGSMESKTGNDSKLRVCI